MDPVDRQKIRELAVAAIPSKGGPANPKNALWGPRLKAFRDAVWPEDLVEMLDETERLRARVQEESDNRDCVAKERDAALADLQCARTEIGQMHRIAERDCELITELFGDIESLTKERDSALTDVERLEHSKSEWVKIGADTTLSMALDAAPEAQVADGLRRELAETKLQLDELCTAYNQQLPRDEWVAELHRLQDEASDLRRKFAEASADAERLGHLLSNRVPPLEADRKRMFKELSEVTAERDALRATLSEEERPERKSRKIVEAALSEMRAARNQACSALASAGLSEIASRLMKVGQ